MRKPFQTRIKWFLAGMGLLSGLVATGQERMEGTVSYITSQHVYVRFNSTYGLSDGDTLFTLNKGLEVPVLVILNHSSTSCVCEPIGDSRLVLSSVVFSHPRVEKKDKQPVAADTARTVPSEEPVSSSPEGAPGTQPSAKQAIHGRISLASYSSVANRDSIWRQSMRYTFSLAAVHPGNTKLSVESYISFRHSNTNWEEIRSDLFKGLKIYNLSVRYDFSESMYLLAGRKINPRLSSAGAIDGLQFEKGFGALTAGLIAGSRPDYSDYRIDPGLFQYGAYLAYEAEGGKGKMQNTVAFMDQMNGPVTDRRFLYFQHTNSMIKNLFFFGSAEVDLYKNVDGTKQTVFELYNTYLSLRYRIFRPLTVRLSYSARNNLVYYESYKDFLERLLEEETLQGWRAQLNYRPLKYLYLGAHAGYRYRKSDPVPSRNIHGYLTVPGLPGVGGSITATVTWMRSAYLDGLVYGADFHKELIRGRLDAGLQYHFVDYFYRSSESDLNQHVGEASLVWSIFRKLSLSVNYEGTYGKPGTYHRVYFSLSQRF